VPESQPIHEPAEIPSELDRWNWGAFLMTWIWGIGNSTWISFLMFVPGVNLVMWVMLGLRGSRWAWKNNSWKSPEHFRSTQRTWAWVGVGVWTGFLLLAAAIVFGVGTLIKNTGAYSVTMETLRESQEVREAFGEPLEDGFMPMGSVQTSGAGGIAEFSIPISGPRAEGTAVSKARKGVGEWRLTYLAFRVEGGEAVVLIERQ
jgi:hypothetical protein